MSRFSYAFSPFSGQNYKLSVTSTSGSQTITGTGIQAPNVRMYNAGPDLVFIKFSKGASTAVTTDMIIPVGVVEVFGKAVNIDTISAVSAGGTANLYMTCGEGV